MTQYCESRSLSLSRQRRVEAEAHELLRLELPFIRVLSSCCHAVRHTMRVFVELCEVTGLSWESLQRWFVLFFQVRVKMTSSAQGERHF